jgi:4,5-DOPA dioxygenase extradiol
MTNGGSSTAGRGVPGARMPVVFVSHGSPMVAIETGIYQEALERFGREHRPGAMVVISAHWESGDTVRIASAAEHRLVYDFGGFPRELYELTYPAAGDPGLARRIDGMLRNGDVRSALDPVRGWDHGVWVPLRLIYPKADVPIVELSIPGALSPAELFRIGGLLSPLRSEGVVILGSGGIVHNLGRLDWRRRDGPAEQWAWDIDALLRYQRTAPSAALAVPTNEHFHPLFVALGAAREQGRIEHIHEGFQYGTLSMRSFAVA